MSGRLWAARVCWGGSCSLFGFSSLRFRWVGEHRVLCVVPAITIHTAAREILGIAAPSINNVKRTFHSVCPVTMSLSVERTVPALIIPSNAR